MLRSGKPARLARVSADLLRHYERIGILPPIAQFEWVPPLRAVDG